MGSPELALKYDEGLVRLDPIPNVSVLSPCSRRLTTTSSASCSISSVMHLITPALTCCACCWRFSGRSRW